jgi:hypothetical protein
MSDVTRILVAIEQGDAKTAVVVISLQQCLVDDGQIIVID